MNILTVVIGILVVVIGVLFGVNWFLEFPVPLNLTSSLLGLVAILFAAVISFTQQFQLRKLERIGQETGDTAKKLKSDSLVKEIVSNFFILPTSGDISYKCFFPVCFNSRPLPFITAGDYHALQVLAHRLEPKRLILHGIINKENIEADPLDGNAIFLCTPSANPALKKVLPPIIIRDDEHSPYIEELISGIGRLPCWFGEDYRQSVKMSNDNREEPIKTIEILDPRGPTQLFSPSEPHYINSFNLEEGVRYEPGSDLQKDYGILARLTHEKGRIIIIAGIHQYGTWIVSDFFDDLSAGIDVDHKDIFLGDEDFISVIWGEFNTALLQVERSGVEEEYLWKKTTTWEQIPSRKKRV